MVEPGTLYVVATPIGNLDDLSARALQTLRDVDVIACEDTRVTGKLLQRFDVSTKTTSYHQHTEGKKQEQLLQRLQDGESIALVSDAGTPGISDPGIVLVSEAVKRDITVTPIPGPSAVITALSAAGFPTKPFTFFGFPPHKKGRNTFFDGVNTCTHTAVLYESKHRIIKALEQLEAKRQCTVMRELTKKHETILRGNVEQVLAQLLASSQKGEFVIVLAPTDF